MIKQLSNNSKYKYEVIVEIGKNANGSRKRKRKYTETKREAELFEIEMKQKYCFKKNGFIADSQNLTFKQFSDFFIENYCEENLGIKTITGYKSMLERINEYIGDWKLDSIDTFSLIELYKKLKKGTKKKTLTNNTLLHYYNLINLIFTQAINWGKLETNPNKQVVKPKKEKHLVKCYNLEQIKILIKGLTNEPLKYQALIILGIDSGARRSELLALNWEDIDFTTNVLTINKSRDVINGKSIEKSVKNDTSNRQMVLADYTIEVLKKYKQEMLENGKIEDSSKIFLTNDYKNPMYPTTCGKILQKVTKKYELPSYNFHSLRHSTASMLIALGVHPKVIQDRLGHSSLNVTMGTYSHIFQAKRKELATQINNQVFSTN